MVTTINDLKQRERILPRSRPWENLDPASLASNLAGTGSGTGTGTPPVDPPPTPPRSSSSTNNNSTPTILTRQISSIGLIILLYTSAMPFEPFAWVLGRLSGTYLFDRLLGGIILFCSFYFQWRISSLRASVIVSLPALSTSNSNGGTTIRNGRVVKSHEESESGFTSTPVWVWRTYLYWHFAICEAALLVLAEWGPSEILRRFIVTGVVGFLWVVGFAATPGSYKRWAWAHIKAYLFVMILDEIRRVAWSAVGANSNARRARQARW